MSILVNYRGFDDVSAIRDIFARLFIGDLHSLLSGHRFLIEIISDN